MLQKRHFASFMMKQSQDQDFNKDMSFQEEILTSIAKQIESKCKREYPKCFDHLEYQLRKKEILEEIKSVKHFSETDWPECVNMLFKNIGKSSVKLKNLKVSSGSISHIVPQNVESRGSRFVY